jgi:threonine dehydrogenase-like Zn-dependent dehydrogenase
MASLLTLSDVLCTGHHGAIKAGVSRGDTVTVIGDGGVGLGAVLAAKRLGAEQIILMGRHTDRTDLGRDFGASDIVAERGDDGVAKIRGLSGGDGTDKVIECVAPARPWKPRSGPSSTAASSAGSESPSTRKAPSAPRCCSAASPSPVAPPRPGPTSRN